MDTKARIVRVTIDQGKAGLLYAQSPDLRGLLVVGETAEEVKAKIPSAIADLFKATGKNVRVWETDDGDDRAQQPWVAVPTELVAAQQMGAIGSDD